MKKGVIAGRVIFAGILTLLVFGGVLVYREGTAQNTGLETAQKSLNNIALGRSYTMKPAPNYGLCTDENDSIELTDGKSFGSNWTVVTTVGWTGGTGGGETMIAVITIDLGSIEPIRGVSYIAAAGSADVGWPSGIFVLVSDDGKDWYFLGDLTSLSTVYGVPPEIGGGTHRYWTDRMKAHGRYVQFLVRRGGYTFVDEIEVYHGEDEWVNLPIPGQAITDPEKHFADASIITQAAIQRRLFSDLRRRQEELEKSGADNVLKSRLQKELDDVKGMVPKIPPVEDPWKFRSIFPLNDLHARVFAVHGAIMKSRGAAPLTVWTTNRFDMLIPTQQPPVQAEKSVFIAAMKGETRSGTFNLTNATEKPVTVTVQIEGLPGGLNPKDITVHRVEWTETKESVPIAAALVQVNREGKEYPIVVPAGMTRQVWLNFTPREVSGEKYQGKVVVKYPEGPVLEVPLTVRVFNETFPEVPTLHFGGWDYTNTDDMYYLTPEIVEPLIAHLRERYVDTPWASADALPYGKFDANGKMTEQPDTVNFDRWVSRWPGARRYAIFVNVGDDIGGLKRKEPAFNSAVGEWISFWVNHAASKGIKPGQILLLLVDEPGNQEMSHLTIDWAKPIKAAQPGVVIWVDLTYKNPQDAIPELWDVVDIVCPRRHQVLYAGEESINFYRQQPQAGRQLELYSCSWPGYALDPYSYHRLQAWTCFDMGATGSHIWGSVQGRGRSWNEYVNERVALSAVFFGPDSVTAAKYMEAAREGIQDYEYLMMLRDRINKAEKVNPTHPALAKAKNLLASACSRVLNAKDVIDPGWQTPKDRSIADQVLVEIGDILEKLAKP